MLETGGIGAAGVGSAYGVLGRERPEVREQFSTRILARYSLNAWRMLALEIHPAPKSTKHQGRAQVVIGGSARDAGAVLHRREAHQWATTGPAATVKGGAVPAQLGPVPPRARLMSTLIFQAGRPEALPASAALLSRSCRARW
ncbi:hypothetical protein ACH4GK_42175 [Streptomyces rimosus]|uniref:hypothetical protein n=1 Tax=Streptomyces rimosus TaxID=1927 RepID=UPI0004C69345|nr:hypothetical protein [Streptomyces rimosus]